jgi:hypothetical protein
VVHEGHREAGVVSTLVEEVAVEGAFQEVVAVALLHGEEAGRGVVSHGDVVDCFVLRLLRVDISAFSGLCMRCLSSRGLATGNQIKIWPRLEFLYWSVPPTSTAC